MALNSLPPPGTGYFVAPPLAPGPGVLLIPSPWGLTRAIKAKADELAEAGFTVLAPDLNNGIIASDAEQASALLMEADMNVSASLVQSSLRLLQAASADPTKPVGVLGYAAGASWALWLSVRCAELCTAVVGFYGTQSIAFDDARASYLLHFAENDADVGDDEVALMGLSLQMAKRDFRIEQHEGVVSGFAEASHPGFSAEAEAVAWRQTLEFFAGALFN